MTLFRGSRCLPFLICTLLIAQQQVSKLNIVIVEGDGAINNIRQRVAREPIVQVEDENRKPIAGASVVFFLPNQGASGAFANGARSLTVVTDSQGRAVATSLRPNNVAGKFEIRVTASHQGQTASATISQTNFASAAAGLSAGAKALIIIGVAGAAVAGATIAASGGNGSTPSTPSTPARPVTTITPGTGTVGGPQ
jgi:hypothetical protein